MKRKEKEYKQALIFRRKGKSIKQIAKLVGISTSTASLWCREVQISSYRQELLKRRPERTKHLRRLAKKSHMEKISRIKSLFNTANADIKSLTPNELFLTGLALYWAEGFKSVKESQLGFCNSDPRMIKFMLKWFKKSLKVKNEDFTLRAEFNTSHRDRELAIRRYWATLTGITLEQFNKSLYHRSIWLRNYPNRENYFGVLRIRVKKSSELLNKMRGWINGLSHAG